MAANVSGEWGEVHWQWTNWFGKKCKLQWFVEKRVSEGWDNRRGWESGSESPISSWGQLLCIWVLLLLLILLSLFLSFLVFDEFCPSPFIQSFLFFLFSFHFFRMSWSFKMDKKWMLDVWVWFPIRKKRLSRSIESPIVMFGKRKRSLFKWLQIIKRLRDRNRDTSNEKGDGSSSKRDWGLYFEHFLFSPLNLFFWNNFFWLFELFFFEKVSCFGEKQKEVILTAKKGEQVETAIFWCFSGFQMGEWFFLFVLLVRVEENFSQWYLFFFSPFFQSFPSIFIFLWNYSLFLFLFTRNKQWHSPSNLQRDLEGRKVRGKKLFLTIKEIWERKNKHFVVIYNFLLPKSPYYFVLKLWWGRKSGGTGLLVHEWILCIIDSKIYWTQKKNKYSFLSFLNF